MFKEYNSMRIENQRRNTTARTLLVAAVGLSALLITGACTTFSPRSELEPGVELEAEFMASGLESSDRWWTDLGDPGLDTVIETALADSLSLRMAWSRLNQMRAIARAAGADRFPSATVAVSAERRELGGDPEPLVETIETKTASLGISYQIDLWQRISNSRKAALLDLEASEQDAQATALAITASAAELWYLIAAQHETLDLLHSQLEVGQSFLDLVQLRFGNGLASAVDVYQQRLQLETTRGQIPAARTLLETSRHQLAVLLGLQPRSSALPRPPTALPQLQPLPSTGTPATVLRRRPDVRAAELRVLAADHRLAVAIADRYPSLRLGATVGGQAPSFSDILDSWFVDLAVNLVGPLLDGGRRKAEVDRNRALTQELVTAWQAELLGAAAEVENALVNEQGLLEGERILVSQLELAEATLDRSRALYVNGLTDYLTVLTSLQSLQALQRQAVSTRFELLSNRIQLHLALGGSWVEHLSEPQTAHSDIKGPRRSNLPFSVPIWARDLQSYSCADPKRSDGRQSESMQSEIQS